MRQRGGAICSSLRTLDGLVARTRPRGFAGHAPAPSSPTGGEGAFLVSYHTLRMTWIMDIHRSAAMLRAGGSLIAEGGGAMMFARAEGGRGMGSGVRTVNA